MSDWKELQQRAVARYQDGAARLPDDPDARQRQLTRMGNAAGAAGLAALMAGEDGREWLRRAADRYRESWEDAPPGSWGRPIGAIKARILAGDWAGAEADALAFLAAEDVVGYVEAMEAVLESFETRDEYLEDLPVADTVLVLQALAGRRGMAAELESELLP